MERKDGEEKYNKISGLCYFLKKILVEKVRSFRVFICFILAFVNELGNEKIFL